MNERVLSLGCFQDTIDACSQHSIGVDFVCKKEFLEDKFFPASLDHKIILVDDHVNIDSILNGIMTFGMGSGYSSIISDSEDLVVIAEILRNLFQKTTTHENTILLPRNKYLQKARCQQLGIPAAKIKLQHQVLDSDFPVIAKEVNGAGGYRTQLIKNRTEFDRLLCVSEGDLVFEEYVHGAEHLVDGWFQNGRVQHFVMSKYTQNVIETKEQGHGLGAIALGVNDRPELQQKAISILNKFIPAEYSGVFHAEMFLHKDNLSFGEIGFRSGGAYVKELYKEMFSYTLPEADVLIKCNKSSYLHTKNRSSEELVTGWKYLRVPPNRTVASAPGIKDLMKIPGVLKCRIDIAEGDKTPDMRDSSANRGGMILCAAETEEALLELFVSVQAEFSRLLRLDD